MSGTNIDTLNIQITSDATSASKAVSDLSISLGKLRTALSEFSNATGGITNLSKSMKDFGDAAKGMNDATKQMNIGRAVQQANDLNTAFRRAASAVVEFGTKGVASLARVSQYMHKLSTDASGINLNTGTAGYADLERTMSNIATNSQQARDAMVNFRVGLESIKTTGNRQDFNFIDKNQLDALQNAFARVTATLTANQGDFETWGANVSSVITEQVTNVRGLADALREVRRSVRDAQRGNAAAQADTTFVGNVQDVPVDLDQYSVQLANVASQATTTAETFGTLTGSIDDLSAALERLAGQDYTIAVPDQTRYADAFIGFEPQLEVAFTAAGDAAEESAGRVNAATRNMQRSTVSAMGVIRTTFRTGFALVSAEVLGVTKILEAFVGSLRMAGQAVQSIGSAAASAGRGLASVGSSVASIAGLGSKFLGLTSMVDSAKRAVGGFGKQHDITFKQALNFIVRYGFGVRSLFMLFRRLRSAVVDGFKNLAQYSSETNASISLLSAGLNQLKNSMATAFDPILQYITPALDTLISYLVAAANAVAHFFAALTGKSTYTVATKNVTDYAASLDKTGSSASGAKDKVDELKKSILGFDEINKLDDPDKSSSGGSGGGGGAGKLDPSQMFETKEVESKFSNWADDLKKMWEKGDFTDLGVAIGGWIQNGLNSIPWDAIQGRASKIGSSLATLINGAVSNVGLGTTIGNTIGNAIMTGTEFSKQFWSNITDENVGRTVANAINSVFNTIEPTTMGQTVATKINKIASNVERFLDDTQWRQIGSSIAGYVNSAVENIEFDTIGRDIGKGINGIANTVNSFLVVTQWRQVGTSVADVVNEAVSTTDFKLVGATIGNAINALADTADGFFDEMKWAELGTGLADIINAALAKTSWTKLGSTIADGINGVVSSVTAFFTVTKWYSVGTKLATTFNTVLKNTSWSGVGTAIADAINGLSGTISGLITETNFAAVGAAIRDAVTGATTNIDLSLIGSNIRGAINGLFSAADKAFDFDFAGLGSSISSGVNSSLEGIEWSTALSAASKFGSGVADALNSFITPETFGSIGTAAAGAVKTALEGASSFLSEANFTSWGKSIASAINNFFTGDDGVDWASLGLSLDGALDGILDAIIAVIDGTKWDEIAEGVGTAIANINWSEKLRKVITILKEAVEGLFSSLQGTLSAVPLETAVLMAVSALNFLSLQGTFRNLLLYRVFGSTTAPSIDLGRNVGVSFRARLGTVLGIGAIGAGMTSMVANSITDENAKEIVTAMGERMTEVAMIGGFFAGPAGALIGALTGEMVYALEQGLPALETLGKAFIEAMKGAITIPTDEDVLGLDSSINTLIDNAIENATGKTGAGIELSVAGFNFVTNDTGTGWLRVGEDGVTMEVKADIASLSDKNLPEDKRTLTVAALAEELKVPVDRAEIIVDAMVREATLEHPESSSIAVGTGVVSDVVTADNTSLTINSVTLTDAAKQALQSTGVSFSIDPDAFDTSRLSSTLQLQVDAGLNIIYDDQNNPYLAKGSDGQYHLLMEADVSSPTDPIEVDLKYNTEPVTLDGTVNLKSSVDQIPVDQKKFAGTAIIGKMLDNIPLEKREIGTETGFTVRVNAMRDGIDAEERYVDNGEIRVRSMSWMAGLSSSDKTLTGALAKIKQLVPKSGGYTLGNTKANVKALGWMAGVSHSLTGADALARGVTFASNSDKHLPGIIGAISYFSAWGKVVEGLTGRIEKTEKDPYSPATNFMIALVGLISAVRSNTGGNTAASGGIFSAYGSASIPQFANGGLISALGIQNIPRFAGGGSPHGTLFLAGEAGSEIVANVGHKTEVLNRSQIASSIYQAVRSAMADSGSTGTPQVNVYVGGQKVTDVVVENINRRTRSTGICPILT